MTACSKCMPARYRQAWKGPADRQIDRARNQALWTGVEYFGAEANAILLPRRALNGGWPAQPEG